MLQEVIEQKRPLAAKNGTDKKKCPKAYQQHEIAHSYILTFGHLYSSIGGLLPEPFTESLLLHLVLDVEGRKQQALVILCVILERGQVNARLRIDLVKLCLYTVHENVIRLELSFIVLSLQSLSSVRFHFGVLGMLASIDISQHSAYFGRRQNTTIIHIIEVKRKNFQRGRTDRTVVPEGHDELSEIYFARTVIVERGENLLREPRPFNVKQC